MHRLDHHAATVGLQHFHQGVGDLAGQPLLHLRSPRVALDQARQLAQADDAAARDIADVGDPRERQQVVLAEGGEGDVAQDDHLLVPLVKGRLEMLLRVFAQTGEELCVRLGDTMRRALQPLSIGIFADGEQDLAHRRLDARLVEVPRRSRAIAPICSRARDAHPGGIEHASPSSGPPVCAPSR